jgi:hypothetical protein
VTVAHVPIRKNHVERPSRLFTSNWDYIRRSVAQILRVSAFYSPLRAFASIAGVLFVAGVVAWLPFLWNFLFGDGGGHLQSLILGAVLMIAAIQMMAVGLLADMLGKQRALSQQTHERVRRIELHIGVPPSHYEHPQD